MAAHIERATPSLNSRQDRIDRIAGTDDDGYKNVLDFIVTLVVVNSNSLSLTQIVN
jgi:hypothetical protein